MTAKQIATRIAVLRNKLERATTKPDPTGRICEALRTEIAELESRRQDAAR